MRTSLVIAFCLLFINHLTAQQRKTYVVKAGEIPLEVLPNEAMYSLPAFTNGTVFLRDGTTSRQKFNYNIPLDEMHFIGANNDTLAIAEPEMIKYVLVDTFVYYYDKSYLRVIAQMDSFKIAIKQVLVQSPYQTRGGYDAASSVSAISTYGSVYYNGQIARLQIKKDVELEKKSVYFISDRFNHFLKADKKAFFKIFSTKKDLIDKYLTETRVDFNNEENLKKLWIYCTVK